MEFLAIASAINLAGRVLNAATSDPQPVQASPSGSNSFASELQRAGSTQRSQPPAMVFAPASHEALQQLPELKAALGGINVADLRLQILPDGSINAFDGDQFLRPVPLSLQSREAAAAVYRDATQAAV